MLHLCSLKNPINFTWTVSNIFPVKINFIYFNTDAFQWYTYLDLGDKKFHIIHLYSIYEIIIKHFFRILKLSEAININRKHNALIND